MERCVAIFGLNGSSKSILAHALAKALGLYDTDTEDYYLPAQAAQRNPRSLARIAARLSCPVYDIDGTQPADVCLAQIPAILRA